MRPALTTSFSKKCFGCLGALRSGPATIVRPHPVGNAAAADNNGRDLLKMGIYPDRLLQVQMASVSEIKARDMRPRLLSWTEVRMNKRRMLTQLQRNCHLTLAASLYRRPPAEATRDLTFHG